VLRDRLVAAGGAREHRWRPDSGWVTIALDSDRAVFEVLALLRTNYERGLAASGGCVIQMDPQGSLCGQ
jgi:hypothetical protein